MFIQKINSAIICYLNCSKFFYEFFPLDATMSLEKLCKCFKSGLSGGHRMVRSVPIDLLF